MGLYLQDPDIAIFQGSALTELKQFDTGSLDCCVTSPPYFGLRDYGHEGQVGLEPTPAEYVASMVEIFQEVRRVLKDEGTLWLNLGDTYAANRSYQVPDTKHIDVGNTVPMRVPDGLKAKDLIGIPWMVAFALRDSGWYLRSDIIWSKPNAMPESVTDRPTNAHEYIFLFSKSSKYFFDQDAVREPFDPKWRKLWEQHPKNELQSNPDSPYRDQGNTRGGGVGYPEAEGRNIRSVWEIISKPYSEAHFATFPEELPRRCILAGCPKGGIVLDPFLGSGTTALVARNHERRCVGIELSPDYCALAAKRLQQLSLLA